MSELRLIVGQPGGLHGLSWRLWVHRECVYILARTMRTSMKVSVHPPGPKGAHTAFFFGCDGQWIRDHPEDMEPQGHPRIEQYYPRELGPGVRRIATIRVHPEAVTSTKPVSKSESHIWLDAPANGRGIEVSVLLAEHGEPARDWCLSHTSGLLGGILDESTLGDVLVYASHKRPGPALGIGGEPAGPMDAGDIEAVAFGLESIDGSLVIEEVPVHARTLPSEKLEEL